MKKERALPGDYTAQVKALVEKAHPDYRRELKGVPLARVGRAVDQFSQDFLIQGWMALYLGTRGSVVEKVVAEILALYPGFRRFLAKGRRPFPASQGRLDYADRDLFSGWLRKNSIIRPPWGAIAWLACISEIPRYHYWVNNLRNPSRGFDYIPYREWLAIIHRQPDHKLFDVPINPENFREDAAAMGSLIDFYSKNQSRLVLSPFAPPPSPASPVISQEVADQIELHGFKFQLPIDITGDTRDNSLSEVKVGDQTVYLNDADFSILLGLVVSALTTDDGAIRKRELMETCDKAGSAPDQALERVRKRFQNKLGTGDPKDYLRFIEKRGKGRVRLSVHRAFIKVNKNKLVQAHHDSVIKEIARKLPRCTLSYP